MEKGFFERLFAGFIKFSKTYLFWTLIASIILYFIAFYFLKDNEQYRGACTQLASTLVAGALLGSIIRSNQFSEIFKDQLREIMFSEENLERRSDIDSIWKKVSSSLYKSKFPAISDDILDKVNNIYLPTNHNYYQESFEYEINIEWLGDGYIKLTEVDITVIIPHSTETVIEYDFSSTIDLPNTTELSHQTSYDLVSFEVNSKDELSSGVLTSNSLRGANEYKFNKTLRGSKKYEIKKKEIKIYNIYSNPYKKHTLTYFTKKYDLSIEFPNEEINVVFTGMGTKDFKEVTTAVDNGKRIKKRCNNLMFPETGFIIFYQKL